MDCYEFERYKCTAETCKQTLSEFGVAVVPSLLDEKECKSMVDGLWNYFEHITDDWDIPVSRTDEKTWRGLFQLFPKHGMLHQHFGAGQCQAAWDVRQNAKVAEVFSTIWKCKNDKLLVSFDGLSFSVPPEVTNRGWPRKTWFHTDQSYARNKFECIQGWVTGLDIEDGDATLAFYEKSHHLHKEFAKQFEKTEPKDWAKLNEDEEKLYKARCEVKKIKCPKGSLVLWDSRTIHCGSGPIKGRKNPKIRAVIYTCYMPRQLAAPKAISKKRKAFEKLRTTNHWPCRPKLFAKFPRTYGKKLPALKQIEPPLLSKFGKKLAGF